MHVFALFFGIRGVLTFTDCMENIFYPSIVFGGGGVALFFLTRGRCLKKMKLKNLSIEPCLRVIFSAAEIAFLYFGQDLYYSEECDAEQFDDEYAWFRRILYIGVCDAPEIIFLSIYAVLDLITYILETIVFLAGWESEEGEDKEGVSER